MTSKRLLALLLLTSAALLPAASAVAADKETKKWLESVGPLILIDEQKVYDKLKDKTDQAEFQKLFWARRDPDLTTPENEYQVEYEAARAKADERFKGQGTPGSLTDCGKALILLGEPAEVKANPNAEDEESRAGTRKPEIWRYKGERFVGGEALIAFDSGCMGPKTDAYRKQMDRVAAAKVVNPNIDYRVGKDGHLTKLADLLPKPSPAQTLLKTPREDFPIGTQIAFLKAQGGGTAVLGLVHGDASALPAEGAGAQKKLSVVVCAQAQNADGKVVAFAEQPADAVVGSDGAFVASFRMILKAGTYTVKAGALEPKTGKGSLSQIPVEVPDLDKGELTGTLWLLQNVEEKADAANAADPYAAFTLGTARLIPHIGQTFAKGQSAWFFYQYYDAKVDEHTSKAAVVASASIFRRTALLAKSEDQSFDTPVGGTTVGPIDLATYIPGSYRMQVKVVDGVSKKELIQEVTFEVTK